MRKSKLSGVSAGKFQKAKKLNTLSCLPSAFLLILAAAILVSGQISAFTYQGRLTDGSMPANGSYSVQFALFNAETGGTQIGSTQTALVTVTGGIFTVKLDFGTEAFDTSNGRFLEIAVKKNTDPDFTILTPRQEITSVPFARRANAAGQADSLSSACVGCVTNSQIASVAGSKITGSVANATNAAIAANALNLNNIAAAQYVLTTDARLTNPRTPTGAAGGSLTGTYPNPTISNSAVRGAQIADGSLGMHDLFVFTGSGFAAASPFVIAANSCTSASLNLTNIFDVNEDDVVIVSMKNKPPGLVITPYTLNANDNTNNLMVFEYCNVASSNLVILPTSVNRYMILRPGGNGFAETNENSQTKQNVILPPPVITQTTSSRK